jgi:hypothetical protein
MDLPDVFGSVLHERIEPNEHITMVSMLNMGRMLSAGH